MDTFGSGKVGEMVVVSLLPKLLARATTEDEQRELIDLYIQANNHNLHFELPVQ